MQDIRRQNDVDRWRNKLRLQEKFEVKTFIIFDKRLPTLFRLATLCRSVK